MASSYMSMGESQRSITDYLNRFSDVVSYQDSSSLKQLLSLSSESPNFLALADALNIYQDANRLIRQADKYSQYAEIVAPLFRAMQSYRVRHFAESYQAFEKSANAFIQEFRNWESAWALEALYVVVYEIRILAERADRELASNGKTPEKL
nr:enhanced ethylene response protein 5 [Tanacetum cinerariifolium]